MGNRGRVKNPKKKGGQRRSVSIRKAWQKRRLNRMSSEVECPKMSKELHNGTTTEMNSVIVKEEPISSDDLGSMDTPDLVTIKPEPEDRMVGERNIHIADVFDRDKWNTDIKEEHEMEIGETEVKLENDHTKCNGSGSLSVDETSISRQSEQNRWKEKFLTEIIKSENEKSSHFKVLAKEKYLELLGEVEQAERTEKKTQLQQRRVKRFGVLDFGGIKRLFARHEGNLRYHLPADELYDVIEAAHLAVGHAGRDKMLAETSKLYSNITKEMITLYLSMCEVCQQKKTKKRVFYTKPIFHSEINNRCQVDLIDFQTQPDGKYKFIMVYQDLLTKFVLLRALESNTASEVAFQLNDIFLTIGAPCILQSDKGKEFVNLVINELTSLWPELKIVHGKTRDSLGSVDYINKDIDKLISSWLKDNKSTRWSEGLRYVQFAKNRAFHPGIKQSPYKAMFGTEPKVGLRTTSLPSEMVEDIQDEDDLQKLIEDNEDINLPIEYDKLENDTISESGDYGVTNSNQKGPEHMEQQAKKMKTVSDKLYTSAKVEDTPNINKGNEDLSQNLYSRFNIDIGEEKCQISLCGCSESVSASKNTKPPTKELQMCTMCSYSSPYSSTLKRHMLSHTGEKPYKCTFCEYSASNSHRLKTHIRIHTGERPFKCPICGHCVAQSENYHRHLKTHAVEKTFKCNLCEYAGVRSVYLRQHMMTHTGEKPYHCPECDYSAALSTSLRVHMRTHTGVKPYKCSECDYAATQRKSLKQHMLTHTGVKPYKCDQCDYAAAQANLLKVHVMKAHMGEKPYNCSACEYSSTRSSLLKAHIQTHLSQAAV